MRNKGLQFIFTLALSVSVIITGFLLQEPRNAPPITIGDVTAAEHIIGLRFSDAKRDSLIDGLVEQRGNYENIRTRSLPNSIPPALVFNPVPVGMVFETQRKPFRVSDQRPVALPANRADLAFYSIGELSYLIRNRLLSSTELTHFFLDRLKSYGPVLECVVTLTGDIALRQAGKADGEIARGKYRGPLHGIPYGIKDLLSTRGVPTTWGSVPYKDQVIDEDATVVRRLEEAGAVLVAKLTLGELAWGDVWFGGKTRNPWKPTEGSSGSSAGSAAATAAGLVPFAIGSETWGSIVSPSTVCGTTGLRPSYGRVSRIGAMALSWSMDKIGPICRSVEDCAIVFNAIYGPDGKDQTLYDVPFNYSPDIGLAGVRIGYLEADFDSVKKDRHLNDSTLAVLRRLGANLVPVRLPEYPIADLSIILTAEAGAAFDELTRSGKDDLLVRQIKNAWPNMFRLSRFIPAVEYIQANRYRYLLVQEMRAMMDTIDVILAPPFEGDNLLLTNLTGHPCVVLPNGFAEDGTPRSICFIGPLFGEAGVLARAKQYQDATGFHHRHPRVDEYGKR